VTTPASSTRVNGLDRALSGARRQRRTALLGYLPVGYPTLEGSIDALVALGRVCDIVEVGVPYSDPVMDGPPIQAATQAALRAGTRIEHVFEAVNAITTTGGTAVVMSYGAPVLRYGTTRFAADLAAAGGSGLILPDLPVEEAGPWRAAALAHGLRTIHVAAPNSDDARLSRVCGASSGFIYSPASRSTTGARGPLDRGLAHFVARLRNITNLPICAGVGVHNAATAATAAALADGVIVGSAFVRLLLADPTSRGVTDVETLANEIARAIRPDA